MKKIHILFICVTLALQIKAQQDPQYNLYQFNQMVINPAYAGARDGISVIASVRKQWAGIDGAPNTNCFSVHSPLLNKTLGAGLTVVNDKMGPRTMTGANANIAYILKLNQKYKLSFGLSAGYYSYRFDFTKLTFKATESNTQILETQKTGVLDISGGAFLRSNGFFLGLSATHLSGPTVYNYSSQNLNPLNYRLRPHVFLTFGKSIKLSDNAIFAPTVMLKTVSGNASADLNLNFFVMKKVWLGVFYRGGYGPGFLMQYYVTNKFRVAYSYDTGMTDARRFGATHEIMIGFDFSESKSKIVSPRFL